MPISFRLEVASLQIVDNQRLQGFVAQQETPEYHLDSSDYIRIPIEVDFTYKFDIKEKTVQVKTSGAEMIKEIKEMEKRTIQIPNYRSDDRI